MQRRIFFTSPVDHHDLAGWDGLARSLRAAAAASCDGDVSITIGTQPVFGYDTDVDEALAELAEQRLGPRDVRLDLWCSVVCYATVCVTLGPGIRRPERRVLTRRLRGQELARQTLLGEHEGLYDLDSGRVFGYRLSARDDRGQSTLAELLDPFDGPAYLGEEWLLHGEGGRLDEESFELVSRVGGGKLALFLALDEEAEARAWAAAVSGRGLIAFYPEDPAEEALVRDFEDVRDLPILLAEAPSAGMRVTIGRCRRDDDLVVVYGPPWPPEIDEPLLFVI